MRQKIGVFIVIGILLVGATGCDDSSKHEGQAKTPSGSSAMEGRSYVDVVEEFEKSGFVDIKTEPLGDLITGWLKEEGEVKSVTVAGDENYSSGKWVPNDVEVIIKYHSFKKETAQEDMKNGEEPSDENATVSSAASSTLDSPYPLRAAVVALTNGMVSDVYADDRTTMDRSKFHSFSDVSGEFFLVKSEGNWTSTRDNSWRVDGLELETQSKTIITASLNVDFDGQNYIMSNITGMLGTPGTDPANWSDISEIELSSEKPYLTVPQSMVEKDRDETQVKAKDRSGDLDKNATIKAFEEYGKSVFPYGFQCHWIADLRNEEQYPDGSWFFKVGVTVKNENGEKIKALAEGKVSGTTANPVVSSFLVN